MTLTFSHTLQFFTETPFSMCARTWVSCYLNAFHLPSGIEQSPIPFFFLHLQWLRAQLLNRNPHSWTHMLPLLHCWANLLLHLLSYERWHLQREPSHQNPCPQAAGELALLLAFAAQQLCCSPQRATWGGKLPSGYKHLMAQFHQFILLVVCPHQRHHLLVCFNTFMISLAGIPSLEGRFCQHGGNATAPPYRWTDMDDLSINGGQTAKTMTTSQSKRYEIQINKVL